MTTRERLETEFGIYSEWLAEAIADIEPSDLILVACRGTGRPDLFGRLADDLEIGAGSLVLDLGSGLGGPAAWLTADRGCRVVGIDLMETEVGASVRLFPEVSAVIGTAERLPWPDASFDAVWSLGMLEMIQDKARVVAEVARVLKVGRRVGVYGFFAADSPIDHPPTANRFVPVADLQGHFVANRLRFVRAERVAMSPMPVEWQQAVSRVRNKIRRDHQGDARLTLAESQLGAFNWLRTTGRIRDWIVVGEKMPP